MYSKLPRTLDVHSADGNVSMDERCVMTRECIVNIADVDVIDNGFAKIDNGFAKLALYWRSHTPRLLAVN